MNSLNASAPAVSCHALPAPHLDGPSFRPHGRDVGSSDPADPLRDGLRLVWWDGEPVKVPHVCACCMALMEESVEVQLYVGSEESPGCMALPVPYCRDCKRRVSLWEHAKTRGTLQALFWFGVPAIVAGLLLMVLWDAHDFAELIVEIGISASIGVGALWFARRRFRGDRPGHVARCEAVTSEMGDAFTTDGRAGGVLVFANWRFGLEWAKLNGVQKPKP